MDEEKQATDLLAAVDEAIYFVATASIADKFACICGMQLTQVNDASTLYDGNGVWCDICNYKAKQNDVFWHCSKEEINVHKDGIDICDLCIILHPPQILQYYLRLNQEELFCICGDKLVLIFKEFELSCCSICKRMFGDDYMFYHCDSKSNTKHLEGFNIHRECLFILNQMFKSITSESLTKIINMGYKYEIALRALTKSKGDIKMALNKINMKITPDQAGINPKQQGIDSIIDTLMHRGYKLSTIARNLKEPVNDIDSAIKQLRNNKKSISLQIDLIKDGLKLKRNANQRDISSLMDYLLDNAFDSDSIIQDILDAGQSNLSRFCVNRNANLLFRSVVDSFKNVNNINITSMAEKKCNVTTCSHLNQLKNVLRSSRQQDIEYDNIDVKCLLNSYHHLLFKHQSNNDFDFIYNEIGSCRVTNCELARRRYIHTRNINQDDRLSAVKGIINEIHCHYSHSYDFGYRLTKLERENIIYSLNSYRCNDNDDQFPVNDKNKELLEVASLLLKKQKSKQYNDDIKQEYNKFNRINCNQFDFGRIFRYRDTDVDYHTTVKPKCSSFKDELLKVVSHTKYCSYGIQTWCRGLVVYDVSSLQRRML